MMGRSNRKVYKVDDASSTYDTATAEVTIDPEQRQFVLADAEKRMEEGTGGVSAAAPGRGGGGNPPGRRSWMAACLPRRRSRRTVNRGVGSSEDDLVRVRLGDVLVRLVAGGTSTLVEVDGLRSNTRLGGGGGGDGTRASAEEIVPSAATPQQREQIANAVDTLRRACGQQDTDDHARHDRRSLPPLDDAAERAGQYLHRLARDDNTGGGGGGGGGGRWATLGSDGVEGVFLYALEKAASVGEDGTTAVAGAAAADMDTAAAAADMDAAAVTSVSQLSGIVCALLSSLAGTRGERSVCHRLCELLWSRLAATGCPPLCPPPPPPPVQTRSTAAGTTSVPPPVNWKGVVGMLHLVRTILDSRQLDLRESFFPSALAGVSGGGMVLLLALYSTLAAENGNVGPGHGLAGASRGTSMERRQEGNAVVAMATPGKEGYLEEGARSGASVAFTASTASDSDAASAFASCDGAVERPRVGVVNPPRIPPLLIPPNSRKQGSVGGAGFGDASKSIPLLPLASLLRQVRLPPNIHVN
jgi:hypothetical protein